MTGQSEPVSVAGALQQATAAYRNRNWAQAEQWCREILHTSRDHVDALNLLGIIAAQTERLPEAAGLLERAAELQPGNGAALNNLGGVLRALRRFEEAKSCYDRALALDPADADVHYNRALTLQDLGQPRDALKSLERSLALDSGRVEAQVMRGNLLRQQNRLSEALEAYQQAIGVAPRYAEAWNNRGAALQQLRRLPQALESFDQALAIDPALVPAHNNRGNALQALGRHADALGAYDRALGIRPGFAELHGNRANALSHLGRFEEARAGYDRARRIQPDYEWLSGNFLHSKMQLCEWSDFSAHRNDLSARVLCGEAAAQPFMVLNLVDSLAVQHRAAQTWAARQLPDPATVPVARSAQSAGSRKIRIGYFSADFHNHATSFLMAGLFECHDRERFELVAVSFGPDRRDEMRTRVAAAFDRFIEVGGRSDAEVAELSRTLEIDIAVDLKGYTQDKRSGIFAHRAAPLQASYLGYPGTMGTPHIDYVLADRIVIPPDSRMHYTEKVVYLPHSYYPTSYREADAAVGPAAPAASRAELGLPADAFVYCCFNNHVKITPPTFDGWMRILLRVPGSVLWLLVSNGAAKANLRREAEERGVNGARLIFAERLPARQHLARHGAADLFLDTLPYNAHTTATDALWAGLPVLTRLGESFAARVAGSLLTAVGLPGLVTSSQEDYETLAIALASERERLNRLRALLRANRATMPLFDTRLLTRHLELAYAQMYRRHHAGLRPDHIEVFA